MSDMTDSSRDTDDTWPNVHQGLDTLTLAVLGVGDFALFVAESVSDWPEEIVVTWDVEAGGDAFWSSQRGTIG